MIFTFVPLATQPSVRARGQLHACQSQRPDACMLVSAHEQHPSISNANSFLRCSYDNYSMLQASRLTSDPDWFACSGCQKGYNHLDNLKQHMSKAHGVNCTREGRFTCQISGCQQGSFYHAKQLVLHYSKDHNLDLSKFISQYIHDYSLAYTLSYNHDVSIISVYTGAHINENALLYY